MTWIVIKIISFLGSVAPSLQPGEVGSFSGMGYLVPQLFDTGGN
jgi:hypothetical protein